MVADDKSEALVDAKRVFDAQGYYVNPSFIDAELAADLLALARHDPTMQRNTHAVLDAAGRESRLTLWYEPGDDAFGRLSCCAEMVSAVSTFLGGPVSFFHAKLMQKRPQSGGRWEWHQDYGYWYEDGFLRPDMASCYIALEDATESNGCLQVVPGSHLYGRLEHHFVGEQQGADRPRVDAIVQRQGVRACELKAGDALFFHANLLHMSGPNTSKRSRLGLITSFFRRDNESITDDPRFKNQAYASTPIAELRVEGRLSSSVSFLSGRAPAS